MTVNDWLIVTAFAIVCTLIYLALSAIPHCNRCPEAFFRLMLAGAVVLMLCATIWFLWFALPGRPNYGLGGSYLRLAICPLLYLAVGIAVTIYNRLKGAPS